MKKITLIFLALAVVINSFSVANVLSEAAENDIENEVHTEILEQSGNEWNNQENQKNSSDFSDSDTIQDNSDINATENGVDAEKQDDTKVEDPQNMDDPELTDRANSWRYTDGVLFHQEEIGGKARSRAKAAYNPNATRTGIDVSHHNGTIDWEKVKDSGVDFVIIRCGYGKDEKGQDDKQWSRNVSECERLGIPFGVYLYSYAKDTQSAQSEAQHVLRLINGHRLTYPVYYDMEDAVQAKLSKSNRTKIANKFLGIIKNAGYECGIYANLNWWNNYLDSSLGGDNTWRTWVAQYNNNGCDYKRNYSMWQSSSTAKVSGISGNVDINFWFGKVRDRSYDITVKKGPSTVNTVATPKPVKAPARAKISSVKVCKKKAKVKWKKISSVKGYRIQYSTSKKFTSKKTKSKYTKKTSIKIKKLKSKKTYYFRVKAYKKNAANKKVYSKRWSKVKHKKIK